MTATAEQVVILGSGPAGLTAAIYAARAGLSTLVLDGNEPGGQITLTHSIENFPGFPEGINGYQLSDQMRQQAERFGSRFQSTTVVQVDLSRRPFAIKLEDDSTIYAETVIVATGASANWLGIESEQAFKGKGISSCATCDGFFFKNKEVVVIGGGDTALEDALFLTNYASKITVIHRRDTLKASPYLQKKALAHPKISFIFDSVVKEFSGSKGALHGITIENTDTKNISFIPCQGAFVAIGHHPNTDLFLDQLELTPSGYIVTKPFSTETSVPGVFAAGDVADAKYRQAITAAGAGGMAGIDAYHFINH